VLLGAGIVHHLFDRSAGSFDRRRFEEIVAVVRIQPIKPGERSEFRLDDFNVPTSLRPLRPGERFRRGQGVGLVWAERTKDGQLKVVVETRDAGHAGELGFAFSDVLLRPAPLDAHWSTVDLPGRLTVVDASSMIDEHWWQVFDNLD
jgi:hypothetical protein